MWDTGVDVLATRQLALTDGVLANTRLHARLSRLSEELAKSQTPSVTLGRHPQYTDKAFKANLLIDTPSELTAVMAAAAPKTDAAQPHDAGETGSAAHGRRLHQGPSRRNASVVAGQGGDAPSAVATDSSSAYLRLLRSRLDACEARRRAREASHVSELLSQGRLVAPGEFAEEASGRRERFGLAERNNNPSDGPLYSVADWVSQHCRQTTSRTSCQPGVLSDSRPGTPRKPLLLTQLSTGRFPMIHSGKGPRDNRWISDAAATIKSRMQRTSTKSVSDSEKSLSASTLVTEADVDTEGSEGTAEWSPNAVERFIAESADLQSETVSKPSPLSNKLLCQLASEPIRSYSVLRDATTRPASALLRRPAATLKGTGAVAQENYGRSRHRFEHTRYASQAGLLGFLDWRSACRTAVCHSAVSSDGLPTGSGAPTSTSAMVANMVLETVEQVQRRAPRRASAPPAAARPATGDPSHPLSSSPLQSSWTHVATVLSAEKAREQICRRLSEFTLDFQAAALSKESLERLRTEIIAKVRHKPPPALFTKRNLKSFLVSRRHKFGSILDIQNEGATAMTEADVIDSMPSPAEAAFVRYAFATLP